MRHATKLGAWGQRRQPASPDKLTTPTSLSRRYFPHRLKDGRCLVAYTKSLLELSERLPRLSATILELVVEKGVYNMYIDPDAVSGGTRPQELCAQEIVAASSSGGMRPGKCL